MIRGHARVARFAAPAAFLAAATVAVLLVRSGLDDGGAATPQPVATTTTTAPTTTTTAPIEPVTSPPTDTAESAEFYVIEAGDTLAVVADLHDTTVEQLLVLNPEIDPVALNIGDRIRVK